MTPIPNGTAVRIRTTNETGTVIGTELKRFAYINNGKQVRWYTVLIDGGNIFEYESSEITTNINR